MATAHKSRVLDMTQGDPFRLVLQFSMPLFCSNLLQQLYNLTDTALAGHLLGSAALAEIGATAALYGLIMNFAFGMNNGLALTVSRYFGAGDESGIRRAVGWMVTLSAAVSLVLTGCSLLGRDALLTVLQVPAQAWGGASAYLTVILLGIPLTMLYNMEAALLRAVGNSVTPLLFLLFSSVLNVGLDAAFMGPLGLGVRGAGELDALLKAWEHAPHVHMSGMFTHFCFADGDAAFTRAQFERFEAACAAVRAAGFAPVRHAAASTAMLDEAYQLDMVRLGIALYGTGVKALDGAVRPAQTLRTHPLRVCEIEAGETVGYSRAFRAARRTRVMTIPCGYGDGYPRILSGRADVLVNGRRAPVIGNICMDMMMADVTDAGEITPESEVVLLGAQGGERITPDELARLAETIPYEIMLGFSQRVARRFA